MKHPILRLAQTLGLATVLGFLGVLAPRPALADDEVQDLVDVEEDESVVDSDPSALTIYRSELDPHGTWVVDATYGTVWVPHRHMVGPDFAPYVSAGHWELTEDADWLWVSDYSWGYIPFHYGRWVWVSGTGWAWIPGRVYSHAWVVWRIGPAGYIGWAPMAPSWYWANGLAVVLYAPPVVAYSFCPTRHVFHHHVHRHVVRDKAEVRRAAASTRPTGRGRDYTPASPSLKDASVDEKDAPKYRSKVDKKASNFDPRAPGAKHSFTARDRGAAPTYTKRAAGIGRGDSGRATRPSSPTPSFPGLGNAKPMPPHVSDSPRNSRVPTTRGHDVGRTQTKPSDAIRAQPPKVANPGASTPNVGKPQLRAVPQSVPPVPPRVTPRPTTIPRRVRR